MLIVGILMLAGAAFTLVSNSDIIFSSNVTDINKLLQQGTIESNVDSFVEIRIDAVLDNFAETTHKTNGITTGKDQHFLVWLDDDSVIAVSVKNKKLVSELNRIMDETWDYLDEKRDDFTENTAEVKGKIKKMSTEMRKYYQESLDYIGVSEAGFGVHYYQVDCTTSRLMYIIVSAVLLVLGLLLIIAFIVTRKKLSAAASDVEIQEGGYSYNYSYGSGQDAADVSEGAALEYTADAREPEILADAMGLAGSAEILETESSEAVEKAAEGMEETKETSGN